MRNLKAYIAGGWFSVEQERRRVEMIKACDQVGIKYYSPKDHGLYTPGETDPRDVFQEDIKQIKEAGFLLVSTAGKDMGTLFECGVAYAKGIPLVYYFPYDFPLNLMLAQSAKGVVSHYDSLVEYLELAKDFGVLPDLPFSGDIE